MARPNPNDFRVLPPNDEDLIPLYIGSDVSKPFWIKWKVLREILTPIIPSGTAAWGSIATGGGVASQTDLIAYLVANYYPLLSNPAGYVTATQLSTTLLGYVTTAALTAALANYVPTSRTLTINGVTFDLSADRSWTVSGGGGITALTGDVTASGTGSVAATIAANAVTFAKMQNISTQKLLGRGTAGTGNVEQIGLGSGFSIDGSNNLQFSQPTPVAAKFYQQDNWSAVGTGNSSVEYVASLNKVYVTNFSSNTVTILNATTGEFINTVAATACVKCKYIASVNQIYVTSSSATVIIRIDGATNLPLANISLGVTANGVDILEYSISKVFITCSAGSSSIMVVDPVAGVVTATILASVPAFAFGMALNTNALSLQFNKIVIGAGSGVCIFDPTTNAISTSVANPSSAISNAAFLTYSATDDKYYVASSNNARLVVLSIATATTFTATILGNQQNIRSVVVDETNDYLFMFPLWSAGGANIAAKMFKKTTLEPIVTIQPLSQAGAGAISGLVSIDLANNRIFLVGRTAATGSVSILRYV